jgi:hypothetical protein
MEITEHLFKKKNIFVPISNAFCGILFGAKIYVTTVGEMNDTEI